MVALIGPNGAGKSTLMALAAGIMPSTTGCVRYAKGISLTKGIGYLPEHLASWDGQTPTEFLTHIAHLNSLKNIQTSIQDLAAQLFFKDFLNTSITTLSKGVRQRVFLAAAILPAPDILILDEPTDGLDPTQQSKILNFLKELAKTRAVFVSTHQLNDVQPYFTRVIAMQNGAIKVDTTPTELARHGKGDISIAYRAMMNNKQQGRGV